MFNVVYALGEMAMLYPISGGFYTYSVRFIDPSWGFAMGWNYVFQWVKLFDVFWRSLPTNMSSRLSFYRSNLLSLV